MLIRYWKNKKLILLQFCPRCLILYLRLLDLCMSKEITGQDCNKYFEYQSCLYQIWTYEVSYARQFSGTAYTCINLRADIILFCLVLRKGRLCVIRKVVRYKCWTLPNVYDQVFCESSSWLLTINYIPKKVPTQMFTRS